ncbi:T-complex protein 1 subunit zeta [Astathelohania contejeani]|uniref:T-complex protein 1 subunit zeta n=1 Tax=Astathelohania contejeani TaxID=164912 RepID=A0ABQ7HZI6_9MICR|nr:T-complex protein 1 subunit zeta [Thelohania contejeani]
MSYFSQETQITQTGQAIRINAVATSALAQLFASNIGPSGSLKMLVSPSQSIRITKDGTVLCKEVQFTHPTSLIINKAAQSLAEAVGDGTSSFVVFCCELFACSFKFYNDGTSLHRICSGIQNGMRDVLSYLDSIKKPATQDCLEALAFTSLNTKVDVPIARTLAGITVKALKNIAANEFFDINMVEIMKMEEGDVSDTTYIEGLVLDHGGRHPLMPTYMEDVLVMITNISLEYEKPEINSQFFYSSATQRDALVAGERKYIYERARAIADFASTLKGKKMLVVTERGIDPVSLDVLSSAGILALRRAKRRNLERLTKMCGGNIITRLDELKEENLGYCKKVWVKTMRDEKFTFVEGTPFKGSCTILVRGNSQHEMDRMVGAIKSTLKSLGHMMRDGVYLEGGPGLYVKLSSYLSQRSKVVSSQNVVGYKVLSESLLWMAKVLIKNSGGQIEDELIKLERGERSDKGVIDNYCVIGRMISNACMVAVSLLMVDEIIKAGKPVKEENK